MGGLFSFGLRSGCDEGLTAREENSRLPVPSSGQQILQGDLLHLFLHGGEDLIIGLLEHRANPGSPPDTGGRDWGAYPGAHVFVRSRAAYTSHTVISSGLRSRTAPPVPRATDRIPCLLQGAEQVADHHRIAAGAGCQSGAGHPPPVKYRNADQTVQRNGTFGTDAHGVSPLITRYHLIGNL